MHVKISEFGHVIWKLFQVSLSNLNGSHKYWDYIFAF